MINQVQIGSCTWTDVESPTPEEVSDLNRRFCLDTYITEELPASIERSKIRFFNAYTYVVLQFPNIEDSGNQSKKHELDFIIGKDFLISVRYERNYIIPNIGRDAVANPKEYGDPIALFFHIVFKQYREIGRQLEKLDAMIEDAEDEIFTIQKKSTVEKISTINRRILDFKRAMRFHADIWKQVTEVSDSQFYIRAQTEYLKLWNALEHYQEITHSLQTTNDSLISYRTNEVMKLLTVLNFIILPISLIPTVLGLVNTSISRIFIVIAFIIISFTIYSLFKKRTWI